jgi:hypothetical protein
MRIRALLLVCLLVLMSVSTALAQEDFVSPDEDWQVEVPRGFDVEVNDNGVGYLTNEDMEIQFYSPTVLEDLGYEDFDDPQDLVETIAETEEYEVTEIESANSVPGQYITIFGMDDVGYIAIGKLMSDDTVGFALITIYEDAPDDAITEALDIVATFDVATMSSASVIASSGASS